MATRQAFRFVSRARLSSSGKMLSEEEKAAENVYIKKVEQEKLEKLARKGVKAEGQSASSGGSGSGNGSTTSSTSTDGVSTDKNRNYAVVAGVLTGLGALGWYFKSKDKKVNDLHD